MVRTNEGKPPGWHPSDDYESDEKESDCWLLDSSNLPFHSDVMYHQIFNPMLFDRGQRKGNDSMVHVPICWMRLLCLRTYPKTLKDFGTCFPFSIAVYAQMENSLKVDNTVPCPFYHILRSRIINYSNWAYMWPCGCSHPPLLSLKYLQQRWPRFALQIRSHFTHDAKGEPLDRHAILCGDPDDEAALGHGEIHIVPAYVHQPAILTLLPRKLKRGKLSFSGPKQHLIQWRKDTLRSL